MVLGKCAIDANDVKIVPFNSLEPGIVEKHSQLMTWRASIDSRYTN